MLEIDDEEREYLLGVLQDSHTTMIHEIHHSDTREYKDLLRQREALNERLQERLKADLQVST